MPQFPKPTAADQFDYLLRLYFGGNSDRLFSCIGRAYLDMSRTLHGLARVSDGKELHAKASAVVRSFLMLLPEAAHSGINQDAFDDRHRAACATLCSTYSTAGFKEFRVGQAQKWLNMAVKYVFAFGEERLPGYSGVFALAHIPLDNIILNRLAPYGVPRLATPWSRIGNYAEYLGIQRWVRSTFPDSTPLAVEFALWQDNRGVFPERRGHSG
jgi:hypothetical protein